MLNFDLCNNCLVQTNFSGFKYNRDMQILFIECKERGYLSMCPVCTSRHQSSGPPDNCRYITEQIVSDTSMDAPVIEQLVIEQPIQAVSKKRGRKPNTTNNSNIASSHIDSITINA
jgi:hypothetical protein